MIHPWGVELNKEKALDDTYKFVNKIPRCRNIQSDQEMVDCLRERDAGSLITAAVTVSEGTNSRFHKFAYVY